LPGRHDVAGQFPLAHHLGEVASDRPAGNRHARKNNPPVDQMASAACRVLRREIVERSTL
jgi:hypothetical protein